MIAEIHAGYTSAKAAVEIVKGIQALKSETAINQAVIDIQRLLLETQTSIMSANDLYSASLKRVEGLEAEIARLKDWSIEKQDYVLADTGQGSLAYKYLEGVESGYPPHWICPQCCEDGKKSILKHEVLPVGRTKTLVCHRCGFDVVTQGVRNEQSKLKAGSFGPR